MPRRNREAWNAYMKEYRKNRYKDDSRKAVENLTPWYLNMLSRKSGRTTTEAKRDILRYRIKQLIKKTKNE